MNFSRPSPNIANKNEIHYLLNVKTERKGHGKRFKAAEIKFMRRTAGYTLIESRRIEDILVELDVDPFEKK
jgi:hypothetical protein